MFLSQMSLPLSQKPPATMPFYKIVIPTIDTVRNSTIVDVLVGIKRNTLIVGHTGTGKTVLAQTLLNKLNIYIRVCSTFSSKQHMAWYIDVFRETTNKTEKKQMIHPC